VLQYEKMAASDQTISLRVIFWIGEQDAQNIQKTAVRFVL